MSSNLIPGLTSKLYEHAQGLCCQGKPVFCCNACRGNPGTVARTTAR